MAEKNKPISEMDDAEDIRVTVSLDDGTEAECGILTIFDIGDQDYIVLVPVDENDQIPDDGDAMVFKYYEDEDGEPHIGNIEDPDEWERVADRFDELMDEDEFLD